MTCAAHTLTRCVTGGGLHARSMCSAIAAPTNSTRMDVASGDLNTNSCPAGSVPITTGAECAAAAQIEGIPYDRQDTWSNQPKGCYCIPSPNNLCYFNLHSTGGTYAQSKPLCIRPWPWPQRGVFPAGVNSHTYWRISNAGYTGAQPSVSGLKMYSDTECTQALTITDSMVAVSGIPSGGELSARSAS